MDALGRQREQDRAKAGKLFSKRSDHCSGHITQSEQYDINRTAGVSLHTLTFVEETEEGQDAAGQEYLGLRIHCGP